MSAVASYVQLRDGDYYVGATRVTLRGIVEGWRRGETLEYIQQAYPNLSLVQVFGAMTYYLEHRDEVEANFRETDEILAAHRAASELQNAEFLAEMRARIAKHHAQHGEMTPGEAPEAPKQ